MSIERYRIEIAGLVQGIGFRPFIYQLAVTRGLTGWVCNSGAGVSVEVEGETAAIQRFMRELLIGQPRQAHILNLRSDPIAPQQTCGFSIHTACGTHPATALMQPDLAPCRDCLRELDDPSDRRYRYPFICCTQCGPRFSIIEALPYVRANTSMRLFTLCADCRQEYQDPANRRFCAEAIACPACGPELELCDHQRLLARGDTALQQTVQAILQGAIVAVKSIGGFQLLADAGNECAIARLRERKRQPSKSLALLYANLYQMEQDCTSSALEQRLLQSPQRPIVLLAAKSPTRLAANIAPDNPNLGVMLPCSPLHQLLLSALPRPLIATSGNLYGQPVCIDNQEALRRLHGIADLFLLHDCPIVEPLDDSLVRVIDRQPVLLRRSRGYAPLPLELRKPVSSMRIADGQLNEPALQARDRQILFRRHSDLETPAAQKIGSHTLADLQRFSPGEPAAVVPRAPKSGHALEWMESTELPHLPIPYHQAHFFAAMAEQQHSQPALGVSWDSSGYSAEGIIRGGEFFYWDGARRLTAVASLRPFPLPGPERAIREPRRSLLGLLYAVLGDQAFVKVPALARCFAPGLRRNLNQMLERGLNSPLCTSAGRLFDAIAALLGLATRNDFAGQAAMALEFCAQNSQQTAAYPFHCRRAGQQWLLDWAPMIPALLDDIDRGTLTCHIAARFHNTLARMILSIAQHTGKMPVFLTGEMFQNKQLSETAAALLRDHGYSVHRHRLVPPNDGGVALGQIYFTAVFADRAGASNSIATPSREIAPSKIE